MNKSHLKQIIQEVYQELINEQFCSCQCPFCLSLGPHSIDECSCNENEIKEVTPPGKEDMVLALKKKIKSGEVPKTYIDKKTGKRKKTNPWAIAWASENIKEGFEEDSGAITIPVLGANPLMKQLYSFISIVIAKKIENGYFPDDVKNVKRFSNNTSSKLNKIYGVYLQDSQKKDSIL